MVWYGFVKYLDKCNLYVCVLKNIELGNRFIFLIICLIEYLNLGFDYIVNVLRVN